MRGWEGVQPEDILIRMSRSEEVADEYSSGAEALEINEEEDEICHCACGRPAGETTRICPRCGVFFECEKCIDPDDDDHAACPECTAALELDWE